MSQYNKYSAACPDETELIALKNGTLPDEEKRLLTEHLLLCDYCALALDLLPSEDLEYVLTESDSASNRQIPSILREAVENYRKKVSSEPKVEPKPLKYFLENKEELKVGQIWRTKLEEIVFPSFENEETFSVSQLGSVPHLVVITNTFFENIWTEDNKKYQIIKVIPVSDHIEYAADGDIVFSEEESPLGYPFFLQVLHQQQMIMDNLDACLGEIEVTPESFKSMTEAGTSNVINFLTNKGKQQILDADSDFSFFGILKKGIYSDPKMRFRAREFENTAYLRDPVLKLRESLMSVSEIEENKLNFWERATTKIFELSRVFSLNFTTSGSNESFVESKSFFGGKLLLEGKLDSEGEGKIIFQSQDSEFKSENSEFANKFFPIVKPIKMLVLLSDEITVPNRQASILKFDREHEKEEIIPIEDLMDSKKLSEMFENGEITEEIISNSISHIATESGLEAWSKIAQSEGMNDELKQVILKAIKG